MTKTKMKTKRDNARSGSEWTELGRTSLSQSGMEELNFEELSLRQLDQIHAGAATGPATPTDPIGPWPYPA